ncbi:hypothetical protein WR25_22306 [Diploscapter pachys]|uniref:Uncharacterized protein n=1 Tax=Diploscapter pachys TaxID=2018661 RepID=A0A2A2K4L7_9BILA|nr:hypothetical protein WR25_22306 [Diploscapter pachys]
MEFFCDMPPPFPLQGPQVPPISGPPTEGSDPGHQMITGEFIDTKHFRQDEIEEPFAERNSPLNGGSGGIPSIMGADFEGSDISSYQPLPSMYSNELKSHPPPISCCHWERGRGLTKLRKEGEYANCTQPNKEEKERQIPPSVTEKEEKCLEKEQGRGGICMT